MPYGIVLTFKHKIKVKNVWKSCQIKTMCSFYIEFVFSKRREFVEKQYA